MGGSASPPAVVLWACWTASFKVKLPFFAPTAPPGPAHPAGPSTLVPLGDPYPSTLWPKIVAIGPCRSTLWPIFRLVALGGPYLFTLWPKKCAIGPCRYTLWQIFRLVSLGGPCLRTFSQFPCLVPHPFGRIGRTRRNFDPSLCTLYIQNCVRLMQAAHPCAQHPYLRTLPPFLLNSLPFGLKAFT